MTPTSEQIHAKALELWVQSRMRANQPYETTPEEYELAEEGFLLTAQNMLMFGQDSKCAQWIQNEKAKDKEPLETTELEIDVSELLASGLFVCGTRQCGKTTLVKSIAKRLISEGINVFVVDPSTAWLDFLPSITIEPLGTHTYNWKDASVVFDTSKLHSDLQQKFSEIFCKAVLDAAISRGKNAQPNTVLVFEETHTIFPNFGFNGDKLRETRRLITVGANFNLSFIAITQFSSMIDKLLVKCAQQRFFGRTSEPNDLRYLRNFLGDHTEELTTLQRGEFLFQHCGKIRKVKNALENTKAELQGFKYCYTTPIAINQKGE
jgi:hypothetical protein